MVPRELVSIAQGLLHRPIRIGFVGHRPNQLPSDAIARVRAGIDAALDGVTAAGKEAAHRDVNFTLVTSLAEGADRLAAAAALARGWELVAPLPFSIKRYEEDFESPESVLAFESLLKKAGKVRAMPQHDKHPEAAYPAAGEAVIKGADALIIVWNGESGHGPGGTADVAARALEAGEPALWIGLEERQKIKLILPEEGEARRGVRARYMRAALAARFERMERPDGLLVDFG